MLVYTIHRNHMLVPHVHPWESCTSMSMEDSHCHSSLEPTPLAILHCWTFKKKSFVWNFWVYLMWCTIIKYTYSDPTPTTKGTFDNILPHTTCWEKESIYITKENKIIVLSSLCANSMSTPNKVAKHNSQHMIKFTTLISHFTFFISNFY